MEDLDRYRLQTAFFTGNSGSIHLSLFLPATDNPSRWIIHFPAFAEEMNKSRAVVARTARALARSGVAVVVPDLFGTGDSDGDFVDATWATWLADQRRLAEWAREQGAAELLFWGLRAGCLLAAELASNMEHPPEQLIFWQPMPSGKQVMAQFLRLHMAASLKGTISREQIAGEKIPTKEGDVNKKKEGGSGLREKILAGQSLSVAGYQLGSELFQAVEARRLNDFVLPTNTSRAVFEVVARPGMPQNRVIQRQLEQWRQEGQEYDFSQVPGAPFWSTQELGLAPALVDGMVNLAGFPDFSAGDIYPTLTGLHKTSSSGTSSLSYYCGHSRRVGILHFLVEKAPKTAVVIVVGGPQYRIGSHRQFVMLARVLAAEGYPVLRFDYRGMGDSEGIYQGFKNINPDIRGAIDALQASVPTVRRVVLWGLCDGATASVSYASSDDRVHALVLANPWVFTEQGSARAYLKHYYLKRLVSGAFWSKLVLGRINPRRSVASIWRFARTALLKSRDVSGHQSSDLTKSLVALPAVEAPAQGNPVDTFARDLMAFEGPVLLMISGEDLTAAEFVDATRSCPRLRQGMSRRSVQTVELAGADHTFSRSEWRRQVETSTLQFLCAL